MPWVEMPVPGPRLAVNIADLTRIDPVICEMMLSGKLGRSPIAADPGRPDEAAVEFICDLLTAAAACDVMRGHDRRAGDHPTRVYLRRAVAWVKLPAAAQLTLVEDGKCVLNPEWFPALLPVPDASPLTAEEAL